MNANRAVIDVHILQTVPPSCLNRDDTNSPKTALYGGTRRARVSSQSWKRATRRYFNEHRPDDGHGVRTRKLPEMLAERIRERLGSKAADNEARVIELANRASGLLVGVKPEKVKKMAESKELVDLEYALFISSSAIESALDQLEAAVDGQVLDADALKLAMGRGHSLDVALFGRMIADTPDLNVDAACQVAHAISTHRVSAEFDFYTTVDDLAGADESGAAMMGYVEFNSATLYRYATISLGNLADNLGDPSAVPAGVRAFVEGFVRSLPTGRQNTFGAMTLPDLVFVSLRTDQPVSLVGAFEAPVEATGGFVTASACQLAAHATHVDVLYGSPRTEGWATYMPGAGDLSEHLGASLPFPELLDRVEGAARAQIVP
jgi:CRISPR system Cascade subunit CasC